MCVCACRCGKCHTEPVRPYEGMLAPGPLGSEQLGRGVSLSAADAAALGWRCTPAVTVFDDDDIVEVPVDF